MPGNSSVTGLAGLLACLIEAARGHIIPAPAAFPGYPSITDAMDDLFAAARDFEVIPTISLADHLWTHATPLHSGAVSSSLRRLRAAGHIGPGFLLLYAADIRSPLLYLPQRQPLRVRDGIEMAGQTSGGPFLALVLCDVAPDGRPQAVKACAIPIYHARRLVPVGSDLDRDVLRALEHLQETLDAYGIDCTIRRVEPFSGQAPSRFTLSLPALGRSIPTIHLAIADETHASHAATGGPTDFIVTAANWRDGTLIRWLEKTLLQS